MTRVVAVRHGETDWNRHGRMQGWAPVPLNEAGRRQTERAGAWLAATYDFDAAFVSDLLRCRETAETILEACEANCAVAYEEDWRERGLGVYQGLEYGDMDERFPEFSLGEAAVDAARRVPEGGESILQVADRVTHRLQELLEEGAGNATYLVVTHGGPLHLLLGYVKGMRLEDAVREHRQDNCAVNEFVRDGGDVRIVRENERPWVDV